MKTRNHSFVNDIVRSAIWFNQLQEDSVAMVDCTPHFKENKSTSFQNQIFRSYNEDMERNFWDYRFEHLKLQPLPSPLPVWNFS